MRLRFSDFDAYFGLHSCHSGSRHVERRPVTLSPCASLRGNSAKGLARRTQRSFAALRMTSHTHLSSPLTGSLSSKCLRCSNSLWIFYVILSRIERKYLEMGLANATASLRTASVRQDQRKCLRTASVRQDQR